ncbi:MAG: hypothetical protein FWD69_10485 [Polyangiaceae bacterium]|nr:hypothetical protein [Polyangiaceae bacterium]
MPSREVASSLASTDTIELDGHGFETGDELVFRAVDGGALPSPLVAAQPYFAIWVSDSTFQVSESKGGPPIDLTTNGANVLVATPLPFDEVLEFYSRWVDGFLPAHLVPLKRDADGRYPVLVSGIVAELSAKKLQQLAGHSSVSVGEFELAAKAQLERWSKGVPLRDPAEGEANLSVASSLVITGHDSRGWGSRILP